MRMVKMMDEQNDPIALYFHNPVTNDTIIFGNLHYGDSKLINRLVWLPIQETIVISIFILLGFIAFTIIRNSEKRYIWIGMAKETAHQLGTPVSALLGWADRIKMSDADVSKIAEEMEKDLVRLQQISERFGDMSSSPKLRETKLCDLIQGVIDYLQVRLPSSGDINISNTIKSDVVVTVHPGLFSWAVENILRNAIDAMENVKGNIDIWSAEEQGMKYLYIKDSGPGIAKKDWKNIFRPGYSTKLHGWGLGLSLTKRIIKDLNKADVFVESSSARTGTTIGISIRSSLRTRKNK
jgi:signal transduction histidine kinase